MLFAVAAAQHLVGTARRKCFGLNFTMSRTQKKSDSPITPSRARLNVRGRHAPLLTDALLIDDYPRGFQQE